MQTPSFLSINSNNNIAYEYYENNISAESLTVIFLSGLMSDMNGTKALYLQEFCNKHKLNYLKFDYFGHGQSSGDFIDGTISIWQQNSVDIINNIVKDKKIILVGSSLGGWLMFLITLKLLESLDNRIAALLGVASAPDFTKILMWDKFDNNIKNILADKGVYDMPSDYDDCAYPISMKLIEDGNNNLILNDSLNIINCPIILMHGMQDMDVPYDLSIELAHHVGSQDVSVELLKNADHRMSSPEMLDKIGDNLLILIEKISDISLE
ncbi:MAG: alpha/beta hydrolase [Pseudomonadota bacterium]